MTKKTAQRVTLSTRVRIETANRLKKIAQDDKRTISAFIEIMIEKTLNEKKKK